MMAPGGFFGCYAIHDDDPEVLAAKYAKKVASKIGSAQWNELSLVQCYEAVRLCLWRSGAIKHNQYLALNSMRSTFDFGVFVRDHDQQVNNAAEMRAVPQGSILGFIDLQHGIDEKDGRPRAGLVHAMIAVGDGRAVGTKNSCIGFGAHSRWEELDLASLLTWAVSGDVLQTYAGTTTTRQLKLRYRKLPLR